MVWWVILIWSADFIVVVGTARHIIMKRKHGKKAELTEEQKIALAGVVAHERLMASLNKEQRVQLVSLGYFEVTSNLGNVYRLRASGHMGNIQRVRSKPADREFLAGLPNPYGTTFCMHLSGYSLSSFSASYPEDDHLLAQALLIRTDEVAFRRIACSI